jgi:hypothetical protein
MKRVSMFFPILYCALSVTADVRIIVDQDNGLASIRYETDGETVSAFALDITVDSGSILSISDFHRGESILENRGYGIFPTSFKRHIVVDMETGSVVNWDVNEYTPLADPCDPSALGGLGTHGITVELGALYYPTDDNSPNAPDNSGILCKLAVSETCTMTVQPNTLRGGIVLTDPSQEPHVDLQMAQAVIDPGSRIGDCIESQWSIYDDWLQLGRPACWCQPYQCDGDVDGDAQGIFQYRVFSNDLNMLSENWRKTIDDPTLDPCADIDHKPQGLYQYRVGSNDLNIMIANWKKTDSELPGNCPRPE